MPYSQGHTHTLTWFSPTKKLGSNPQWLVGSQVMIFNYSHSNAHRQANKLSVPLLPCTRLAGGHSGAMFYPSHPRKGQGKLKTQGSNSCLFHIIIWDFYSTQKWKDSKCSVFDLRNNILVLLAEVRFSLTSSLKGGKKTMMRVTLSRRAHYQQCKLNYSL